MNIPTEENLSVQPIDSAGMHENHIPGRKLSRVQALVAAAILAITGLAGSACGKKTVEQAPAAAPQPVSVAPAAAPVPDFMNQDSVTLHGLALLVHNNDQFDKFIFNSVTGNKRFAKTYEVQGQYSFQFQDGREYIMPYHAYLFKPFDVKSNVRLPARLGTAIPGSSLADAINTLTRYKAKDELEIKTIIITSYELSFGKKIDPSHIKIVADKNGRVAAIKYVGPNPELLTAITTIATKTEPDEENPEARNLRETKEQTWSLVNEKGNLVFPPSAFAEVGLAIPPSALPNVKTVTVDRTFFSQGRAQHVKVTINVDDILKDQDAMFARGEPQRFDLGNNMEADNFSWYTIRKDVFIKELARQITQGFTTPAEQLQAMLDFVHILNYVPDAYGEAPRTPRVSLIGGGGDCEDSTILVASLAHVMGLDCLLGYFEGHAAPLCNVGGSGTALTFEGRPYEWAETTGGVTERLIDPRDGRVVKSTKRAWQVGEKPTDRTLTLEYVQRIGGPLVIVPR